MSLSAPDPNGTPMGFEFGGRDGAYTLMVTDSQWDLLPAGSTFRFVAQ